MKPHARSIRDTALALVRDGLSNAETARRLGVPAGTVGYWLHSDRARRGVAPVGAADRPCPRCDGRDLDTPAYSYLLGLYLGDGYIVQHSAHRSPSLVITCDASWPGLIDAAEAAVRAVFPHNRTCRVRRTGCVDVKVYSNHLPCLFPQHGVGRKHERRIVLEGWQWGVVEGDPWGFVRGLVHSDGCRMTNWVERTVGGERRRYEYARYFFTNRSADIRGLFTDALGLVGVEWRQANAWNVSVARRASVELMDRHVGPKY
jgi:hypothetical protein